MDDSPETPDAASRAFMLALLGLATLLLIFFSVTQCLVARNHPNVPPVRPSLEDDAPADPPVRP